MNNNISVFFSIYIRGSRTKYFYFRGQRYYKQNMMSMVTASFAGLLAIIAVPETLRVIKFSIFYN